jgi:hypothetical protein
MPERSLRIALAAFYAVKIIAHSDGRTAAGYRKPYPFVLQAMHGFARAVRQDFLMRAERAIHAGN